MALDIHIDIGVKGKIEQIRHVMAHMDSRESNSDADLEYGEIRRLDDQNKGRSCISQHSNKMVDRGWNMVRGSNGSIKGDNLLTACNNVLNYGENLEIYVDELGEEAASLVKKKMVAEKWKSKKPPKPPRPPGTPSFDEADIKLCREISELARLKYARIRQMKALKKKRADKVSSPVVRFFAMVITILFCYVIIFQGILGSWI